MTQLFFFISYRSKYYDSIMIRSIQLRTIYSYLKDLSRD